MVPVNLACRFAVQASAGIGHGISIVARIIDILLDGRGTPQSNSWLQLVGGCVREGFNDPDKLLLFWFLRRFSGRYTRVATHRIFAEKVEGNLPSWKELPDVDHRRTALYRL